MVCPASVDGPLDIDLALLLMIRGTKIRSTPVCIHTGRDDQPIATTAVRMKMKDHVLSKTLTQVKTVSATCA